MQKVMGSDVRVLSHYTVAMFPAGLSAVEFGQSISVCLLHECIDSYVHAFMYGGVYM